MSLNGQQLGSYRLLHPIGSGGMGEVYLAEDIHLRRQVAIKVIRSEVTAYTEENTAKEAMRLFQREARAIAALDHPHILPLFAYGEEDVYGTLFTYFVMPLRQEGSLVDWLRRPGHPRLLSLQDVEHIVLQAADALQYAHNHQVIHQDVKPSNFLIRNNSNEPDHPDLLLADFGIAKLTSATASASQSIRGTPVYMAPEQWQGHPVPATDQYALAIMAYELLTGRPPFQGGMGQIMFQHFQDQPESPSTLNPRLSKDIDAVVLQALRKNPQERFASIAAFANAFRQAMHFTPDGRPLSSATPPTSASTPSITPPNDSISSSNLSRPATPSLPSSLSAVPNEVSQSIIPTYIHTQLAAPSGPVESAMPTFVPPANPNVPPIVPSRAPAFEEPLKSGSGLISTPFNNPELNAITSRTDRRQGLSRGVVILLVGLALLIIVGSFLYFIRPQIASHSSSTVSNASTPALPKAPSNQQVLSFASVGTDITSFDPATAIDPQSLRAVAMVFTGLVQLDDKLNVEAQLAASWDISTDDLTYTFHLRSNLRFSDGTPLTSADVAYSIDRALSPQVSNANGSTLTYLGLIKDSDKRTQGKIATLIGDSILTPDPNTIILKLNKPAAYFLQTLAHPTSYVVEKSLIDKYGRKFTDHLTEGGGDGPFEVARYDHTRGVDFVPNPDYYGSKPQLQKVSFSFWRDTHISYIAYLTAQLDMTTVPFDRFANAKGRSDFHQIPASIIDYYGMNYLTRPFNNIKIRQAFALALNKNLLAQAAFGGAVLPTNHIVPAGIPGYNAHLAGPAGASTAGNASLAKTLFQEGLQEEGYTSASSLPPITLSCSTNGSIAYTNAVTATQQMWQNVLGVTVKINNIDFVKLVIEIEAATHNAKGLQLWETNLADDYPDPQDWLTPSFGNGSIYNNMNYGQNTASDASHQQQVQQQLEQADITQNANVRMQAYNSLEQQLVNNVAWLPVDQRTINVLLKPWVQGLFFNAENMIPANDWGNIYIAVH